MSGTLLDFPGFHSPSSESGRRKSSLSRVSFSLSPQRRKSLLSRSPRQLADSLKSLASLLNSPNFRRGRHRQSSTADQLNEQFWRNADVSMQDLTRMRRLGEGGFATVDLYKWTRPPPLESILVAVKTLKRKIPGPSDPNDPERMLMVDVPPDWSATFRAEALLARALRHPNVVRSYGCVQPIRARKLFAQTDEATGEATGEAPLMFAQEFCDGGSLLDKVRKPRSSTAASAHHGARSSSQVRKPRSYTAAQAFGWCVDVAAGMDYLHNCASEVRVAHRDLDRP